MRRKLTAEDQLDLFGEPGLHPDEAEVSVVGQAIRPSADSLPYPRQADIDSEGSRFHWPPGFWWVCNPESPKLGCQIESRSSKAALKKACQTHFKGYPADSLEVRQLRVRHGGYGWPGRSD